MTERVLISALMRAFSPTVRDPSELMLPSILPSTTRSFENLTVPLISTSVLSTLRPLAPVAPLPDEGREAELLGVEEVAEVLAGALLLEELLGVAAGSDFCPITF